MALQKLKKLGDLLRQIHSARRQGARVVFTNGCFDLLHVGHTRLLRKAKSLGNLLVVGLNSDESIRRLKGPGRPITPQRARVELLSALEAVDFVVLFNEETPERLIRQIRPDVLVKGSDWKKEGVVGKKFVESYGGKVYLFPLVKGYSTTQFLHAIQKNSGKGKPLRYHRF